ncbi:hypothetical protein C6497_00155 [Candidatus Poribacteria bacterium]|nr:MAG: hypothetical protein C6497_00155 [Candidatus Poribacteria bacterium]
MLQKSLLWIIILGFVLLAIPITVEACPACKELDEPIAEGFNWSVLFMMAMPFTVFGVVGGTVFYHFKRANPNKDV